MFMQLMEVQKLRNKVIGDSKITTIERKVEVEEDKVIKLIVS